MNLLSSQCINDLEKNQDIPPPEQRGRRDSKLLNHQRPPPSIWKTQHTKSQIRDNLKEICKNSKADQ